MTEQRELSCVPMFVASTISQHMPMTELAAEMVSETPRQCTEKQEPSQKAQ